MTDLAPPYLLRADQTRLKAAALLKAGKARGPHLPRGVRRPRPQMVLSAPTNAALVRYLSGSCDDSHGPGCLEMWLPSHV